MKVKFSVSITVSIGMAVLLLFSCIQKNDTKNTAEKSDAPPDRIQLITNENGVDVLFEGKLFTSYIHPESTKKPVLFPIYTAKGTRITRGFPFIDVAGERVDHPHHVGMWLNYGNVNGLDFWNNSDSIKAEKREHYGTVYHKIINNVTSGNEKAILEVTAEWQTSDGSVLLDETTKYIFSGQGDERIIDRYTTLKAVNGDVNFPDSKEGMFAIRVTRALEHPSDRPEIFTDANGKSTGVPVLNNDGVTGKYYNSEGIEGTDCWGKRARWVNLYGTIEEEGINLIIVDHPDNVGYPAYWHARGYGLFSANTLGQDPLSGGKDILNFKLAKGESVTLKYRVIINSGERLSKKEIDQRFENFSGM